ncbi:TPA: hypothetical protein ACH3X2_004003 [Trebouxia sp. C0005]
MLVLGMRQNLVCQADWKPGWLRQIQETDMPEQSSARLRYCGHVMASAYKHIDPQQVSRVFIVGPSHHVYTRQCLLSVAHAYSAPQGQVEIDQDIYSHLLQTGQFERMRLETDEAEHSLELQMPFIMHIMRGQSFKLIPIMVGAISPDREALYGRLLGPFLDDPQNLFIVSSDFCHWGQRFGFTYHDIPKHGSISNSIQWLDQLAMDVIEQARSFYSLPRAVWQHHLRQASHWSALEHASAYPGWACDSIPEI